MNSRLIPFAKSDKIDVEPTRVMLKTSFSISF